MSDDICARCGENGQDRRTLWMACCYRMEETGLPFEKIAISGQVVKLDRTERHPTLNLDIEHYAEPDPEQKPYESPFYTLRVCKTCRAEWMLAIKGWFTSIPGSKAAQEADEQAHPGMLAFEGRIPVRVLGANINANPD
jgi:hypothetical protein